MKAAQRVAKAAKEAAEGEAERVEAALRVIYLLEAQRVKADAEMAGIAAKLISQGATVKRNRDAEMYLDMPLTATTRQAKFVVSHGGGCSCQGRLTQEACGKIRQRTPEGSMPTREKSMFNENGQLWNRHHNLNSSEKTGLKLKQWMT